MCGLLTFISAQHQAQNQREAIEAALACIHHRGPDETGLVGDDDVLLAFKRLAIIDVDKSHQPITYADDRYIMTFNGEIYNYVELRQQLEAEYSAKFLTDGDSETILAAYHYWGTAAVDRFRGMFAFVIWDRDTRTAFGARDPFGIKPLHYMLTDDGLYLASEKKSLIEFLNEQQRRDDIDHTALSHYLTLQYVPEPGTLHTSISRIESGESFTYRADTHEFSRHRYYHPTFTPTPVSDPADLYRQIADALSESVEYHLRSEVPVGAFLSSGIDSTAIVALAKRHKPDILTFTVGYEVDGYSEIEVAQESAKWLGVTTIPTTITADDMMDTLPRILWHLDDPVADPSLIPLYFVAKKAAEHVTVVLSGEGADEFFGGYGIYREPISLKPISSLPAPLRSALRGVSRIMPEGMRGKSFLDRGTTALDQRYVGNAKIFDEPEKKRLLRHYNDQISYHDVTASHYADSAHLDDITRMQYIDLFTWLRGDILTKADRMSMAHSLELRVPFLDREVFDLASTIPVNQKVTREYRKLALRRAMQDIVPPAIVNRPKKGFPVPTRVWLKGPMFEWAKNILTDNGIDEFIDLAYVRHLLDAHRRGDADHSRKIWTVLVLCLWYDIFVTKQINPMPEPVASRHSVNT